MASQRVLSWPVSITMEATSCDETFAPPRWGLDKLPRGSDWGPTTTPARLGLRQSPNRQHRQYRTRLSASPVGFLLVLPKPSLNSFLSDVRAVGTVSVAAASERVFPILMMRVPARPRRARAPLHCPSTRRRSAIMSWMRAATSSASTTSSMADRRFAL